MSNTLTVKDLLACYNHPHYLGVGYGSERRHALAPDEGRPASERRVAQADETIVAEANQLGWSKEDLFEWFNSKHGRWYGEAWFGRPDLRTAAQVVAWVREQRLLTLPTD